MSELPAHHHFYDWANGVCGYVRLELRRDIKVWVNWKQYARELLAMYELETTERF